MASASGQPHDSPSSTVSRPLHRRATALSVAGLVAGVSLGLPGAGLAAGGNALAQAAGAAGAGFSAARNPKFNDAKLRLSGSDTV